MVKKGDTLIEVTLAVGIFSMIAIAVTAVMSSGTAGAQTALETTLTREEIDTQAEAIRFIHTSYTINKKDTENNKFYQLWHDRIIKNAINMKEWSTQRREAVLQYQPDNCAKLYDNSDISSHAFIINPRQLGDFINNTINDPDSVYIKRSDKNSKLTQATIYPRLIYGKNKQDANTDTQSLVNSSYNDLYRAEGIYVIAVKDTGTTDLHTDIGKSSAYYDFYIRTCWYGTDANEPSTISTVIRLYDPDAI